MKKPWRFATLLTAVLTLCMVSIPASATEVTMSWDWPTQYCDGELLPASDLQQAEIYISTSTIPRVATSCDAGDVDVPPAGAIIANVPTSDTSTTIDLQCGQMYYFVIRVQAGGAWSNFSGEATRDIGCGRPNVPITVILT